MLSSKSFFADLLCTLSVFTESQTQRKTSALLNIHETTVSKMLSQKRNIFVCRDEKEKYYLVETKVITK